MLIVHSDKPLEERVGRNDLYPCRSDQRFTTVCRVGCQFWRSAATARCFGLSVSQKNELLFAEGINFNDVPKWQKRGIGFYWEDYDKPSQNPETGEPIVARRRRIKRDLNLPMKDAYAEFIRGIVAPFPAQE